MPLSSLQLTHSEMVRRFRIADKYWGRGQVGLSGLGDAWEGKKGQAHRLECLHLPARPHRLLVGIGILGAKLVVPQKYTITST